MHYKCYWLTWANCIGSSVSKVSFVDCSQNCYKNVISFGPSGTQVPREGLSARCGSLSAGRAVPPVHGACRMVTFPRASALCQQHGNVGPMAITLCQSLGQNIGMMWNVDRTAAGREPRDITPTFPRRYADVPATCSP